MRVAKIATLQGATPKGGAGLGRRRCGEADVLSRAKRITGKSSSAHSDRGIAGRSHLSSINRTRRLIPLKIYTSQRRDAGERGPYVTSPGRIMNMRDDTGTANGEQIVGTSPLSIRNNLAFNARRRDLVLAFLRCNVPFRARENFGRAVISRFFHVQPRLHKLIMSICICLAVSPFV